MSEKRMIDAYALMDAFRRHMAWKFDRERCVSEENCKTCDRGCLWRNIVMDAPTVDAVKVVHGRWIKTETNSTCSACGANVISWSGEYDGYEKERAICMMHYCPNCGAKMDGDGNG